MTDAPTSSGVTLSVRLDALVQLAILVGLASILSVAFVLQFAAHEVPCPLCLLERVAMLGVAIGPILNVRHGHSTRHVGLSLLFALFLLILSVRQVLLDICPRPGHAYVGSAVLGLHMPVWSVVIAVALLLVFSIELALFDAAALRATPPAPALRRIGLGLAAFIVLLAAGNLVSALLQCGFGQCHTWGYKLI